MTFHTFPEVAFEFFEKESYFWQDHFNTRQNIMTNLIRYCGYKTLHSDCFLYRWLQEQIRYFKFGGTEEMRKWITVPAGCEFWQKLPTNKMRVSDEQMRKWAELLHDHHEMLQKHAKVPRGTGSTRAALRILPNQCGRRRKTRRSGSTNGQSIIGGTKGTRRQLKLNKGRSGNPQ